MLPFRDKSLLALRLGHQAPVENTLYEGSVRSSKTFTSLHDWDNYVLHCPEKTFLMSGVTLGALSRNCIDDPEYGFTAITGGAAVRKTDRDGSHFLDYAGKRIYLMGADNEASYKKALGMSIGGWYGDEVNKQHRRFIETALARSMASKHIRNIWTMNPENPNQWFYSDPSLGIDRWKSDFVPGLYRRFHFTLDDNPAITEERKKIIAATYTGVFYKRYILGLRVRAEGGIYRSFVHNKPGEEGNVLDIEPGTEKGKEREKIYRVTFGADFGGNKSATTFNATGWFLRDGATCIVTLEEIYDKENRSVESILGAWKRFVLMCREKYPLDRAFADSEEQLIIKSMNSMPGSPIHVENAMKREIIDRIRLYDVLFAQRRAFIMRRCKHTIEAFENAVWDEKKNDDIRLDDGSTNIDSLDAAEYAVERDASFLLQTMR